MPDQLRGAAFHASSTCLEGGAGIFDGREVGLFLKGKFHERHDEEGQALVEYALILALTTVFALGALQMMSGTIVSFLNSVASALGAAL